MNNKTILKLINVEKNILATLSYDETPVNPLDWDHLTHYYFTNSVDGIVKELFDRNREAYKHFYDKFTDVKAFFNNLTQIAETKGKYIFPVVKYQQGKVKYEVGTSAGWEHNIVGCAIVAARGKDSVKISLDKALNQVHATLENYTDYVNGDVYLVSLESLTLSGEINHHIDSIGDIYQSDIIHRSKYYQGDVSKASILEGLSKLEYEVIPTDWYSTCEEIKAFYYVGK
ncbi:hypothetical protein FP435_00235 (plasmid) [Lactobacillus sp. PV037]|uniref:hypothetical protein n=1 Tax=Lactobacillus sp. PV037 TaxID=2594496 RepID=UPI00223FD307|nr:hypothetical protein [Lactobacillus sp. PV037]QNQ82966.1 hypothetical protein FP435_00235 [Lactobacillus sp. PV037]